MKVYHVSFRDNLGPTLKPQVPAGHSDNVTEITEPDTKRVCFSTSIEGCFYAIYANISHLLEKENYPHLDAYVYTAELDVKNKSFVSNEDLTNKKYVWDAHVTGEVWWLDDIDIERHQKIRFKIPNISDNKDAIFAQPFNLKMARFRFVAPKVNITVLKTYSHHSISAGVEDSSDRHTLSIKGIFDRHCQGLQVNDKLVKRLSDMMYHFVNRNDDHLQFFGGNLTGVVKIRFLSSDQNELMINILDIDPKEVDREIKSVPGVNPDWVISTDTFNLSCQYLSHMIFNSKLSTKRKEEGLFAIFMLLHFKLLGSILHRFFPHPVNPGLAQATYAALSMKFALKRSGNWYKSLSERSQDIYSPTSIHLKTIQNFSDVESIRYMVQDIQNRIRIRIKKIFATMVMVQEQDKKLLTISGTMTSLDGEIAVRDVIRNTSKYTKYLDVIIRSENELIKRELVTVIVSEMRSMPEMPLVDILKYLVLRAGKRDTLVSEFTSTLLVHLFEQMSHNPDLARAMKDPALFLNKLKHIYMASKSTDPAVLKLRDQSEKIVRGAVRIKTAATIASLKTGLTLYIVLRVLSMNKYS